MSIIKRGKYYHLKRRVPKRYATVDQRPFIYKSFKTDSREEAQSKADSYWRELLGAWDAELAGQGPLLSLASFLPRSWPTGGAINGCLHAEQVPAAEQVNPDRGTHDL
ncbi:DUF6538 domain-containing protein [Leisingera aquimarina]|uniref:DUF6538 domain-containing protein n=1 Tax=Leisingera aquimarina TaxID=476529 RepID=UPI003CCBE297